MQASYQDPSLFLKRREVSVQATFSHSNSNISKQFALAAKSAVHDAPNRPGRSISYWTFQIYCSGFHCKRFPVLLLAFSGFSSASPAPRRNPTKRIYSHLLLQLLDASPFSILSHLPSLPRRVTGDARATVARAGADPRLRPASPSSSSTLASNRASRTHAGGAPHEAVSGRDAAAPRVGHRPRLPPATALREQAPPLAAGAGPPPARGLLPMLRACSCATGNPRCLSVS